MCSQQKPTHTCKRFIGALFFCLLGFFAASHADVSSVGYIHDQILSQKGLTVPVEAGVSVTQIASEAYLMRQIDAANFLLNGFESSNYADAASVNVVDRDRTLDDVANLVIDQPGGRFSLTLTGMTAGSVFNFAMSALGNFSVDWGDGTTPTAITRTNTTNTTYQHTYASAGNYTVTISGEATGYSTVANTAAILFYNSTNKTKITDISGSLGSIFPTLADGTNPVFLRLFYGCTGITSLPPNLFTGITGIPSTSMFNHAFALASGLESLPSDLFAGLTGTAPSLFYGTFHSCTGLTSLPAGLFGKISGTLAPQSFGFTFYNCTGLTGTIPAGFFGTFTGAPQTLAFANTFHGAAKLTGIEDGIWDLSGMTNASVTNFFQNTFYGCTGITSASPSIAPGSTVKLWQHFTAYAGQRAFGGDTKMSDYASIPAAWK